MNFREGSGTGVSPVWFTVLECGQPCPQASNAGQKRADKAVRAPLVAASLCCAR